MSERDIRRSSTLTMYTNPNADALQTGGGGGTYNGMDAKIEALEKRVEKFESKLDVIAKEVVDLRVQTATLTERITHLPSKEFIFKGIAGLVAAMVAVSVLSPKLQALFGVVPH